MPTLSRLAGVAALWLVLAASLAPAARAQPPRRQVQAHLEVDVEGRQVTARFRTVLQNSSRTPLDRVPLYLYPNLLAQPGPDLDDVTFPFRFPDGFSPARLTIETASVNADSARVMAEDGDAQMPGLVWLMPAHPVAPGTELTIDLTYRVELPVRFGTFGLADNALVMMGGWHPIVPALTGTGFDLGEVHSRADYTVVITSSRAGPTVVGDSLQELAPAIPTTFTVADWGGPLLVFQRFGGLVTKVPLAGGGQLWHLTKSRPFGTEGLPDGVLTATRVALEGLEVDAPTKNERPFLLVEGPLREVLAIPLQNVVLYSDLTFDVTPLPQLLNRHREDLRSALVAARLLASTDMDLYEALLALNLVQFVRWEQGETDPLYLRNLMRKGEFWGAVDKMGSDPQAHFQSAMFFMPELPASLARSAALFARKRPSPRTAARLLFLLFGSSRIVHALHEVVVQRSRLIPVLRAQSSAEEVDEFRESLAPRRVDLFVGQEARTPEGYRVDLCKSGTSGSLPMEVAVRGGEVLDARAIRCAEPCCPVTIEAAKRPRVLLDPHGVFLQTSDTNDHPRRNDRNYLDLKLVISRPYLTVGGGDRLPTMGVELNMEPRWDLHHRFYLSPAMNPQRGSVSLGWRGGFGRPVRPTYLAHSVSLGLRAAFPLDGQSGGLVGPIVSYTYYTRKSRMNPFAGTWAYAFAYPVFPIDHLAMGSRFGAMVSHLWGRSPEWVFAVRSNLDTAVGWGPDWDVPATGGIDGLRAFGATQASRRHRIGGNVELRWMPIRNLHGALMQMAYITGLQFALFCDAATIGDELAELFTARRSYVDIGLGFRPHFNMFGVMPSIVSLDVAWLAPVLGASVSGYNLVLSFYQPF